MFNEQSMIMEDGREHGENVTLRIVFMRHGEKEYDPSNPETGLTPQGEKNSFEAGRSIGSDGVIKGYFSKTKRTKDTVERAVDGSPAEKKMGSRSRKELGFRYDPDGVFVRESLQKKNDILGVDFEHLSKQEQDERLRAATAAQIDHYLRFGKERPDPGTDSPEEAAAGLARRVHDCVRMSSRLKSGSTATLLHTTHDFNIVSFLKEVLVTESKDGKRRVGFDSIQDIGGPIDFNDRFMVEVRRKNAKEIFMKIAFRDREYGVDMDRLEELSDIWSDRE